MEVTKIFTALNTQVEDRSPDKRVKFKRFVPAFQIHKYFTMRSTNPCYIFKIGANS